MAKHRFSRFVEFSVTYPWECSGQDDKTICERRHLIDDIISWDFEQHVAKAAFPSLHVPSPAGV